MTAIQAMLGSVISKVFAECEGAEVHVYRENGGIVFDAFAFRDEEARSAGRRHSIKLVVPSDELNSERLKGRDWGRALGRSVRLGLEAQREDVRKILVSQ